MTIEAKAEATTDRLPRTTSTADFDSYIGATVGTRSDDLERRNDTTMTANGFKGAGELLGTGSIDRFSAEPASFKPPEALKRTEPETSSVRSNPLTERPASMAALGESPREAPPDRRPDEKGDRVETRPDGTTVTTSFDKSGRAESITFEGMDAAGILFLRETRYKDGLRTWDIHMNPTARYGTEFGADGSRVREFKEFPRENGKRLTHSTLFNPDQTVKSMTETVASARSHSATTRSAEGFLQSKFTTTFDDKGRTSDERIVYDKGGMEIARSSGLFDANGRQVMMFDERLEPGGWSSTLTQNNPDKSISVMKDDHKTSSNILKTPDGWEFTIEYDKRTGETIQRAQRGSDLRVRQGT